MLASKQCFSLTLTLVLLINLLPFNSFAESKNELPKLQESKYVKYEGDKLLIYPDYKILYTRLALTLGAIATTYLSIKNWNKFSTDLIPLSLIVLSVTGLSFTLKKTIRESLLSGSPYKPFIEVDKEGIWHNDFGKITWTEIESIIRLSDFQEWDTCINILPKDRKAFHAKQSWLRWLFFENRRDPQTKSYSDDLTRLCAISNTYLPINFNEMEDLICKYWTKFASIETSLMEEATRNDPAINTPKQTETPISIDLDDKFSSFIIEESDIAKYKDEALLLYPDYRKLWRRLKITGGGSALLLSPIVFACALSYLLKGRPLYSSEQFLGLIISCLTCSLLAGGVFIRDAIKLYGSPSQSKPVLIINKDGIWSKNLGKILWHKIADIYCYNSQKDGLNYINLIPHDSEKFLKKKNPSLACKLRNQTSNSKYKQIYALSPKDLYRPSNVLQEDFENLANFIVTCWNKYKQTKEN